MAERFSDILAESRKIQEKLEKATKKTDLFDTAKGLFLMPQCITSPLNDYFQKKISLEELTEAFIQSSGRIGSENRARLAATLRNAGAYRKESRTDIINSRRAFSSRASAPEKECGNKSCPYRRRCPVANRAKIDTMLNIIALCRMDFPEKPDFIKRLKEKTPGCFLFHIPGSAIDFIEGKHELSEKADNTIQEIYKAVINGQDISEQDFALRLLKEADERKSEGVSVLLAKLNDAEVFAEITASIGNNPMHYKYSKRPDLIWNGTDERLLAAARIYAVNNGALAMEPYRYMDGEQKKYGAMLWCGFGIFIPDEYVYRLSDIIQNYKIITSYCTALVAYLRFPRKGTVFKRFEKDRARHARLKLNICNIESLVRLSGKRNNTDSPYLTVLNVLINEFRKEIEKGRPATLYDLMPYYVPYYILNQDRTERESYKKGLIFDRLAGASFFLPDRNYMAGNTAFSLGCDNIYDFSATAPLVKNGKHIPGTVYPGCAYYIITSAGGDKIAEKLIESIVTKDYLTKYDIHMLYYGSGENGLIFCFISPSAVHDQCVDVLTQAAFMSEADKSYVLISGNFSDFS